MSLVTILEEMADQIRTTLETADVLDVQVEPRFVLSPSALTVDLFPAQRQRDPDTASMGEDADGGYFITVRTRIAKADHEAAYDLMIETMDDASELCVPLALLEDETLNGYAADVHVRDHTGIRAYVLPTGEGAHLGWEFTALVIPAHS